jgi:hypothetical protein
MNGHMTRQHTGDQLALVVEDEVLIAMDIENVLAAEGFTCIRQRSRRYHSTSLPLLSSIFGYEIAWPAEASYAICASECRICQSLS